MASQVEQEDLPRWEPLAANGGERDRKVLIVNICSGHRHHLTSNTILANVCMFRREPRIPWMSTIVGGTTPSPGRNQRTCGIIYRERSGKRPLPNPVRITCQGALKNLVGLHGATSHEHACFSP